jgi:lycopene cyclase domain-containing protein
MDKLYLYLNIFTISLPFLLSFDKKVAFFKSWKYLFPAIILMAVIFIAKDAVFAHYGIWGFNDEYLIGIRILGLPLEEWLFFITVPYACVFIYACLVAYLKTDPLEKFHRPFLLLLSIILLITGIIFYDRLYTSIIFIATGALIMYNLYARQPWLSMFLLSYFVSMLPFFLVNGILTGSYLDNPVVWYDPDQNLGIRMFTIPIEDSIYNLMMLMMTVQFMEWFKKRNVNHK